MSEKQELDYDKLAEALLGKLKAMGLSRREVIAALGGAGAAGAGIMLGSDQASAQTIDGIVYADQLGTNERPVKKLVVENQENFNETESFSDLTVSNLADIASASIDDATIKDRDLKSIGAGATLYDDFGDGKLTADRESYLSFYRPSWTIESSAPTVSNNTLVLDKQGAAVSVTCRNHQGAWEFDFSLNDPEGGIFFRFLEGDDGTFWQISISMWNNVIYLTKKDADTSTNVITHDVAMTSGTVRAVRNGYDWELFVDGSSVGTATDSFSPKPVKCSLRSPQINSADVEVNEVIVE